MSASEVYSEMSVVMADNMGYSIYDAESGIDTRSVPFLYPPTMTQFEGGSRMKIMRFITCLHNCSTMLISHLCT